MMFDNDLPPTPPIRTQVAQHLPIAVLIGGMAAVGLGLHFAVTGFLAVAAAHIVLGLVLLVIRRHRSGRE